MNRLRITAVLTLTACFFCGCEKDSTKRRLKELEKIKANITFEHPVESEINMIDVKLEIGNITVKEGGEFAVKASSTHKQLKPEVTESEGKLSIRQPDKVKKLVEDKSVKCDLEIICPYGVSSGKTFSVMNLESSIGNIFVDAISSDKVTALCEVGNLKVTDCSFNEAVLQAKLGNLSVEEGSCVDLNAASETGNLKISKVRFNSLESKAGLGNIRLISYESLSDYTMDLSAALGRITINGGKQDNPYKRYDGGNKRIIASTQTGNISID